MNVKIKKLYPDAKIPTYGSREAACADLYAYLDDNVNRVQVAKDGRRYVEIKPHCTEKISSGVAMELPEGYCGLIYARSGMATKFGLGPANAVGVCDSDYRGPYIVPVLNHSNQDKRVYDGERIAQLMFVPYIQASFEEVNSLSDTERGEGGFGSTGTL